MTFKTTPILFLGDAPSVQSGLSRIGRDLAILVSKMDEFRVGFLGRGGLPTRKLPFMQYNFDESQQWGEEWLESVWYDFAGDEPGVVFSIWDPSRLLWFGNPVGMPNEQWLRKPPFQKWGYFAIDSEGPGGILTTTAASTLKGYDRVLAYTLYGSDVMSRTLKRSIDFIPHGINLDIFMPRDKQGVKLGLSIVGEKDPLIGCVMTNQSRKDWPLAFETLAILKQRMPNVKGWFKVDVLDRYWDLRALATDFNLSGSIIIDTNAYTDTQMSYFYSGCDLTILPSLGEGFGYPIVESLACGVPCIHGHYAGGAELVPAMEWLVKPRAWRYDTRHDSKRPVYDAGEWVEAIEFTLHKELEKDFCRSSVEYLNWPNVYKLWQKWMREGVKHD